MLVFLFRVAMPGVLILFDRRHLLLMRFRRFPAGSETGPADPTESTDSQN
jgi:hypothetical protein